MGGLAALAAFAILASLLTLAMGEVVARAQDGALEVGSLAEEALELEGKRGKEAWRFVPQSLKISPDGSQIRAELENSGSVPLFAQDLFKADLIILYTRLDGEEVALRLPYDPAGGAGSWRIEAIFTGSSQGEAINPLAPDGSSGALDPTEVARILCQLPLGAEADPKSPLTLIFSSPRGVVAQISVV